MSNHPPTCDDCGAPMDIKEGSVDGEWVNRYLECPDCGRREVPPGPD